MCSHATIGKQAQRSEEICNLFKLFVSVNGAVRSTELKCLLRQEELLLVSGGIYGSIHVTGKR